MQLEQFLSETLQQILRGISDAQSSAASFGGVINPGLDPLHAGPIEGFIRTGGGLLVQIVSFDIALTATESTGTRGGVGVVTGMFNLGSAGNSQDSSGTVSRVQFSVPVSLPQQPWPQT
jgi:hypothetical protein